MLLRNFLFLFWKSSTGCFWSFQGSHFGNCLHFGQDSELLKKAGQIIFIIDEVNVEAVIHSLETFAEPGHFVSYISTTHSLSEHCSKFPEIFLLHTETCHFGNTQA